MPKSIKDQLLLLKQDSSKLDQRLQSSEQLLSQMYEQLVQNPATPFPAQNEFTRHEHKQFLQAINEQGRKNAAVISHYIPTKTSIQIHNYATRYFATYDKILIDIMKQAEYTDYAFKQAQQKPSYVFQIGQLAIISPPPVLKKELVVLANQMFSSVCGRTVPVKDYGKDIKNYIQIAEQFLSYMINAAGVYAIRNIITVSLCFWQFWEEQELQMNNFARLVNIHSDTACAIVFSMLVISCQ